jgi:diguanylate cyclase (GGDEF)-like protein
MPRERILIVDDDPDILDVLRLTLEGEGYNVTEAHNGEEALEALKSRPPDLIVMDYKMPRMDGFEVCRRLRKDVLLRHLPVLILSGRGEITDKVEGIDSGADDYMVKPFEPQELLARVKMILRRTSTALDANPLTRLPGNVTILNELESRIGKKEPFCACYIDLNKFKAYNDKYGFEHGDKVIRETARILIRAVNQKGSQSDFIGHIGGDDFVIVTQPGFVDELCKRIIEEFDQVAGTFYDQQDRDAGYIVAEDRQGTTHKVPLLSISIGVVSSESRKISHVAQIGEIGAELKAYAKSKEGSAYVKDRRRS